MNALYAQVASNPAAISPQSQTMISDLQTELTQIEQAYWNLYQITTGQAPPTLAGLNGLRRARSMARGLGNLGQTYWAWALGIGTFAAIAAGVYLWNEHYQVAAAQVAADLVKNQANLTAQQNVTTAMTTGDPATIAAATAAAEAAANADNGATSPPGWLDANWPWLLAAGAAFFVLQDVL